MQCLEVIRRMNDPQEPAALLETGLRVGLNANVGYESLANWFLWQICRYTMHGYKCKLPS